MKRPAKWVGVFRFSTAGMRMSTAAFALPQQVAINSACPCVPEAEDTLRALRVRTQTGCPPPSDSFMSKTETCLGRRVRALPVGQQQGWRKNKRMATDQ